MVGRIHVSEGWNEDILIWPLTPDPEYSVKSAYRMLVDAKKLSMPSSSVPGNTQVVWKKIWKLRVANKIRHFLWCATKDSLPTKLNLKTRHIPVDDVCDGSGDYAKSLMHYLWLCDQA